jgi:hypothetical protein
MSQPAMMDSRDWHEIRDCYLTLPQITAWETTRRRKRRERVAFNKALRAFKAANPEARVRFRTDPPGRYDEMPF